MVLMYNYGSISDNWRLCWRGNRASKNGYLAVSRIIPNLGLHIFIYLDFVRMSSKNVMFPLACLFILW